MDRELASSPPSAMAAQASKGLDAPAVARLLVEIGQRLVLAGENSYKARAYTRAAEGLLLLREPLEEVIAAGRLKEIPGVGAALSETIQRLHRDSTTLRLEALRAEVPAGVLELLAIPGLRPQKVLDLYRKLGITSVDELEAAGRQDRLKATKGFGPAFQDKVLANIEFMRRSSGQRLIHRAGEHLSTLEANLRRSHPELTRIVPAGDFRRGTELVSDLALVAETPARSGIEIVDLSEGARVWLADPPHYGVALVLATGSSEHIDELRSLAERRGLRLNRQGLYRGQHLVDCVDEKDVYAALNLPFIEPELREGRGEIALAVARRLPHLVADQDIRGLLHCHTDFSDGSNTLEEMAEATRARSYEYFGVADHSKTASYAGGLSVERVAIQHELADELNRRYQGRFQILKGIESDILEDGSLDYPDAVLARFDFVVASVHSRFRLDAKTQTERIIRAVSNPFTTILGHMTGRLLRRREGYQIDVEKILEACARHGVAVEINAHPSRLDLDWRWHQRALELGCMFSINPDAHSVDELDLTAWGVLMARKGGIPPHRVLNCLGRHELVGYLTRRAMPLNGV
ncbi:DNA polymerase/3'-5' exonuclease PolX, partial [Microvirga sp. HBU67558]|nr:DNA polymerase/3'-5' exonuclease PolX [Microvirga sp. HBU67558]